MNNIKKGYIMELTKGRKGEFIKKEIQPWSNRWKYVIKLKNGEIIRAYSHEIKKWKYLINYLE